MENDVLARIADLRIQATTDKSHNYTAKVLEEAMDEIIRLRRENTVLLKRQFPATYNPL